MLVERRRDGRPLAVASSGRWVRLRDASDGPALLLTSPVEVSIVPAAGGRFSWRVGSASAPPRLLGEGPIELAVPPGDAAVLSSEGRAWGHRLRLSAEAGGIDVVSELPIEEYLPGVLAKELYLHWSPAAFEAQAVAARSFAVCEAAHWAKRRHFDVTTGPDTQAWDGFPRAGRPVAAAAATRGVLLAWDGRVVPAYYSSCCGGVPAEAVHAIAPGRANEIPPLEGRSDGGPCCEGAPTFRWNAVLPASELHRRLVAWGRGSTQAEIASLEGVRRVEPVLLNRHGRPVRFAVEDDRGRRVEIAAERLRSALAAGGEKPRIFSGNFEAQPSRGQFTLAGRGFGHGVGLCQHGAEAMGRRGDRWEPILRRYYPQATIVGAWS
jgi:stage II sporulation protein D